MSGYNRGIFSEYLRHQLRDHDEAIRKLLLVDDWRGPAGRSYPDAIEAEYTEQSNAPRPLPLPAEAGVAGEVEGETEGETEG